MYGTGVQDFGSDLEGVDDIERKDVNTALRAADDRNNFVASIVSFNVALFANRVFSHNLTRR
jgi:hypothetical protein